MKATISTYRRLELIGSLRLVALLLFITQNVPSVISDEKVVESRKLTTKINPGCSSVLPSTCPQWTNLSLIHVRGDSAEDSLHFIWSFMGSPSLLLARTPHDSKLNINWDALLRVDNATNTTEPIISFNGSRPYYTFGWSLSTVWIFNDEKDSVFIDHVNQSEVLSYHTKDFVWNRLVNDSEISESVSKLIFQASNYKNHSLGNNGYFRIAVTLRNTDAYSDILPYMLHNANSTHIDIDFNEVQMNYTEPNFPKTRVGFGFTLVQEREESGQINESMRIDKTKSLDDEHTPGVFEMYRILTPTFGSEHDQSYLEWKPICYTDIVRDITNSIDVQSYPIKDQTTFHSLKEAVNSSILLLYYGESSFNTNHPKLLIQFTNITFGTKQDGWYKKTPHLSWTFLTGFGTPPNDFVSLLVILVLSVGLGIPVLMIAAAGIYITTKRASKPSDDLLLGR